MNDAQNHSQSANNQQEQNHYRDESSLHSYRTEIPNCIFDAKLSPTEFLVYSIIKRVAGDSGKCFMSHKRLAEMAGVGEKTIRRSTEILCERNIHLGVVLIKKTCRKKQNGSLDTCVYIVVDLWPMNFRLCSQKNDNQSFSKNVTDTDVLGMPGINSSQNNSGTVKLTEGVRSNLPYPTVKLTDKQDHIKKNQIIKKDNVFESPKGTPPGVAQAKAKKMLSKDLKGTVEPARKYKLTPDQESMYIWLSEHCPEVQEGTRCYWAKTQDAERIKRVLQETRSRPQVKNLGAYMNKLFKSNAEVPNSHNQDCRDFAQWYRNHAGWHGLEIGKNYVSFQKGRDKVEISLNQDPEEFAKQLKTNFENQKRYS